MHSIIYSDLHQGLNNSTMDWPGHRSQRFRGGKLQYPRSIHFQTGTFIAQDMPSLEKHRRHFEAGESSRLAPPLKQTGIKHFDHSTETYNIAERMKGIRTIHFEPEETKERAERLHLRDNHPPLTLDQKPHGIQTHGEVAHEALRHYVVEDRMQRKVRARQPVAPRFFGNQAFEDHTQPHAEDFGASKYRLHHRSVDYSTIDAHQQAPSIYNSSRMRLPEATFIQYDSLRPLPRRF